MEVKFQSNACPCLRNAACQVQNQEQTQEVRLSESMPDIGNVLGSWGQVLIRGKEWRSDSMAVSGGVQVWVLYAPEDGSEPRTVESWIPFQMKWDLEDTQRDGSICITPLLKAVDARSTSARKLMVRANVSLLGEAYEPVEPEVCCPGQIPEDVQLLKKSYPAQLPVEAGEKLFSLEEMLVLPAELPDVSSIIRYSLDPQVIEHKVMAGRLVFRGKAALHVVYYGHDGGIQSWEQELPFSQFTELDKDHSANAQGWITMILTGMELDRLEERKLELKASMAAQYVIYDRVMLELVEDAYSPAREVEVHKEQLMLPVLLDSCEKTLQLEQDLQVEVGSVVDVSWQPEHPGIRQTGDEADLTVPGQFTVLYYDPSGQLQSDSVKAEAQWQISSDPNNRVVARLRHTGSPQAMLSGDGIRLCTQTMVETSAFTESGLPMVKGLELGECKEADPNRPSLILRRAAGRSLWEIAKECGSTVEAICKANQIENEPDSAQMLLIPVS